MAEAWWRAGLSPQVGHVPKVSRTAGGGPNPRVVQNTRSGMSVLARDGIGRENLERVARTAMPDWDGFVGRSEGMRG